MRKLTPEERNAMPSWYDAEHVAWLKRHERRVARHALFSVVVYLLTMLVLLILLVLSTVRFH